MTQKQQILQMRSEGHTMAEIADATGISRNTIKSICRRESTKLCEYCMQPLVVYPGTKEKRFCSDKCRMKYWNRNANNERMEDYVCLNCGKSFKANPKRNRKYCSHECYVQARFKKKATSD